MRVYLILFVALMPFFGFSQDLVILHTNDMHSHLNGFSPETEYTPLIKDNDPTKGGFSRIAGFIGSQKELYGDKLMVVDAGDFLMGTLFQVLELTEGFQMNLMHRMGYEVMALGNHEFDFGPDSLAKIIRNSIGNGPIPELVCSNYGSTANVSDVHFRQLFTENIIKPYTILQKDGYRVGIFSLVGVDANESIPGNFGMTFVNQKRTARQIARHLKRNEKVDLVIVLSHSGVYPTKKGGFAGEDVELGKAVPEIDIIISGHTHTRLDAPIQAGNAVVVQSGSEGLNVGKIEVRFDSSGKPLINYTLVEMNDSTIANAEIQSIIESKVPVLEQMVLNKIGVGFHDIVAETSFDLVLDEFNPIESNLGVFVADALYYKLNEASQVGSDVVLVASGVIRKNIKKGNNGRLNINDIFNVMPLGIGIDDLPGTPLGKIYVTGNELKKVMELILAVYPSRPNFFLHFAGMEIEYNPNKGLFRKISEIRIGNQASGFRAIDMSNKSSELVSVSSNAYMISFIGHLKKMSYGLVKIEPKDKKGVPIVNEDFLVDLDEEKEGVQEAKEWLAILTYLQSFTDINGNGIPDIPKVYQAKRVALYKIDE
jgi:5'-nucleotidase / UDP-sugar diphosphatase